MKLDHVTNSQTNKFTALLLVKVAFSCFKQLPFSSAGVFGLWINLYFGARPFDVAGGLMLSFTTLFFFFFFEWDLLHARLNCHSKAWTYKKTKHKKIQAYRKYLYKEPTVNRCLLILDLKPFKL